MFVPVLAFQLATAQVTHRVDLEVGEFQFGPRRIDALLSPDLVSIQFTNHGPDALSAPDNKMWATFFLSRNETPGDADDILFGEVGFGLSLSVGESRVLEFPPAGRSFITIPADLTGEFHVFVTVNPTSVTDPNPGNNSATRAGTIRVVPVPAPIYTVFNGETFGSKGMTVTGSACFAQNLGYGNSWRLLCEGGSFYGSFNAPTAGEYSLTVRHLSSADAGRPGGGRAPVSIYVNGIALAEDFDPAEQHGGTHGYVTDTWRFSAVAGENLLDWITGDLCTHYWIQRIEITPTDVPFQLRVPSRLADGKLRISITGPSGSRCSLQVSANLTDWRSLVTLDMPSGTGEFIDAELENSTMRFYRIRQEP